MMRRVSSRQRLVSWDAFDASAPYSDTDSDTFETCYQQDADEVTAAAAAAVEKHLPHEIPPCCSSPGSEDLTCALTLKRKRAIRRKQEPPAPPAAAATTTVVAKKSPSTSELSALTRNTSTGELSTTSSSATSCFKDVIPAYDWEFDDNCWQPTFPPTTRLGQLNDDVQLQILEFCDTATVRAMMQVNHRYRNLIASAEAKDLWKQVCRRRWPYLFVQQQQQQQQQQQHQSLSCDLVDALHLPTPAVEASADTTNLALLLALAAEHKSTQIDESAFVPATRSSLRTSSRRRAAAAAATAASRTTAAAAAAQVELKTVQVPPDENNAHGMTAVQFVGNVGMGDRCIRADEPLPRPSLLKTPAKELFPTPKHRSLFQRLSRLHKARKDNSDSKKKANTNEQSNSLSWRPFVAPFMGSSSNSNNNKRHQIHLTPRLISYFEVSILGKQDNEQQQQQQQHFDFAARLEETVTPPPSRSAECVAIGLATSDFSLHTRMPGWDKCSYGYHGDDGGIFHAHGNMIKEYGPHFGVGDTVGCGVDYQQGGIFFTHNGRFLGYAFEKLSQEDLQQDFYPVVGMDTNCPVVCNFGCERPFLFDLNAMICAQRSAILASMQRY